MESQRSTGSLVEAAASSGSEYALDDRGDILVNMTIRSGAEMAERAKLLCSRGAALASSSQGAAQKIQGSITGAAGGAADGVAAVSGQQLIAEMTGALREATPVNATTLSQDRALLGNYVTATFVLGAFGAGAVFGKYVCSIVLGAFLSGPAAVALSFAVVPIAYCYIKAANRPSAKEMKNYDVAAGAVLGGLNGFLLSGYPSLTSLPVCLVPFCQAATIHLVCPTLLGSNPVKRSTYVGTVSAVWTIPFLCAEILVGGGLGVASVGALAACVAGSAAAFQIAIACKQGRCKAIGNLSTLCVLMSVCAAESLLTVAAQQTYEQISQQSSSA